MRAKNSSSPAVDPTTYNGQQFDAPLQMTKAWARVTLLVAVGVLAIGSGIAGAMYVSPIALGAGAILGLPFVVFGAIMAIYTWATHKQIYPSAPKAQVVKPSTPAPVGEVGHVVAVAGKDMTLPNLDAVLSSPAPALAHFPICANDVLYVVDRGSREGLGFRAWTGERLPSGVKLDRDAWVKVQDGLLRWQFATARETKTGRIVELRQDVDLEAMLDAVRKGASSAT